jgi:hypothetical protein
MDKDALFDRIGSWIRWRYGQDLGSAFVVVTAPKQLPAAVQEWAIQHRDAVWQLVWLGSDAVLCGLAPTTHKEQFAVVQHTHGGVTTGGIFSRRSDGSWNET